jgi:hypothetical protein
VRPAGKRRAALTGGLLLVGVISISKPARVTVTLPSGVKAMLQDVEMIHETLWRPELLTAGFPVQAPPNPLTTPRS